MAMSVAKSETTYTSVKKIKFTWVSAADGSATGATVSPYDGRVIACIQIPDSGATQPTNAYDITVTDADGVNVLHGLGADLSNAATTYKTQEDKLGVVAGSVLTLNVTNAGDTMGGVTILYIR
jgi:hypothetical protein